MLPPGRAERINCKPVQSIQTFAELHRRGSNNINVQGANECEVTTISQIFVCIFQFVPEPTSERWCHSFPHVDNDGLIIDTVHHRGHRRSARKRVPAPRIMMDPRNPPLSCPLPRQRVVPSNVSNSLTRTVILIRWMRQAACASGLWDFVQLWRKVETHRDV
jgi:hypothetical protein